MGEKAFIRALSRQSKIEIIDALARIHSYRGLAGRLMVSPAAVYKYATGKAAPRDEVVFRALEVLSNSGLDDIMEEVYNIMARDVLKVLEDFVVWSLKHQLLTDDFLDRTEKIIGRARLVRSPSWNGPR